MDGVLFFALLLELIAPGAVYPNTTRTVLMEVVTNSWVARACTWGELMELLS